jgi:uncharacterized protein
MDAPLALREFLEYVVGSLIEHRELASISQRQEGNRILFDVLLHEDDVGHVIGRNGHTIKALRSLMTATAIREGLKVSLKVDPRSDTPASAAGSD